ncbi:MAG: hypothetical protein BGO26_10840 [Actinobacteria bacterium 69-20]|nr:hypothetical protein [Actinomycetota bacterium]OJV26281.1 MAG: hypothetical protein BGO26_10840 [Actinobacteria bacterium 69-20]
MDNDNHAEPATPTPAPTTATTARMVGPLTVTLWPDESLGEHQRYAYRITEGATGQTVEGRDLFTGAGQPVDPDRALRDLAGYLSAAGESRQYALDHPGDTAEHEGLFPDWLVEAARLNLDALALLAEDPSTEPDRPAELTASDEPGPAPRRWISVVFLQGAEADEALDLIDRAGTDAAIEYLAGYDFGDETVDAALENGYVYDTVPNGTMDRVATRDVYTLTYNHSVGHVGLVREYDALPDPALLGIDTPIPAQPPQPASAAPATQPAPMSETPTPHTPGTPSAALADGGRDWFAPPPGSAGTSQAPGRGPSL